jgi:flagellar biogenesis protein FliO
VLTLTFVIAALSVFALVDRVAPPPETAKPAAGKPGPKARKDLLASDSQPFSAGPLVAVAGVLGGAVGAMFLLKRALKGTRHVPSDRKIIKVRDVLAMGPKRAIYLIGLEDRNLVIGLSGDQMTLLSEYSELEESAEDAPAARPAREGRTGEMAMPVTAVAARSAADRPTQRLDVEVADEVDVPPADAEPPAPKTASGPRVFSFASVTPDKSRSAQQRSERVPHKFRQLLEQAAEAQGSDR